jgi:hypothetical protein
MGAMFTIPSYGSCLWHWVFHSHNETWRFKKTAGARDPRASQGIIHIFLDDKFGPNPDVALYKTGWPTPSYKHLEVTETNVTIPWNWRLQIERNQTPLGLDNHNARNWNKAILAWFPIFTNKKLCVCLWYPDLTNGLNWFNIKYMVTVIWLVRFIYTMIGELWSC